MDVKEVFSILSNNKENVPYSSFLYETKSEKKAFTLFIRFGAIFLISSLFSPLIALISVAIAIFSLIGYTIFSFLSSRDFITNPIKYYVKACHEDLDEIEKLSEQLSHFPYQVLTNAKQHFEFESIRLKNKVSFVVGSISKVGIFPTLIAFLYAVYEYQSKSDYLVPFLMLGSIVGVYSGTLLIQRIINWQESCIYILEYALNTKFDLHKES